MEYSVLDKGFIKIKDIFGTELDIVNSARVSFGKQKHVFDEKDEKLIKYLITNKHYSPFRQIFIRIHIKAPEFVMRQIYRHIVGIEVTSTYPSQLHGFNEISGRYVEMDEYYIPNQWRIQSKNNKQGSDGELSISENRECQEMYKKTLDIIIQNYNDLIHHHHVAKEQARILLPLSIYTEAIWTLSLQAMFNFVELRMDSHAQYEIREYAKLLHSFLQEQFPIVCKYWNI
jgi:thymidylate synthase (FAD)